jgi:predicted GTPase
MSERPPPDASDIPKKKDQSPRPVQPPQPVRVQTQTSGADSSVHDDIAKKTASSVRAIEDSSGVRAADHAVAAVKYIDVLCFGRARIGKSSLLEAVSGLDFESKASVEHGTTFLTHKPFPIKISHQREMIVRYWDSVGIDKWESESLKHLFGELEEQKVRPLVVLYCASAGGTVKKDIVHTVLQNFASQGVVVCYVITNRYSMSTEDLKAQWDCGVEIMTSIFPKLKQVGSEKRMCAPKATLIAVNSKPYVNDELGVSKEKQGIDELMTFIGTNIEEEQVSEFFLASLGNRDFWTKAAHSVDGLKTKLKKGLVSLGVDPQFLIPWLEAAQVIVDGVKSVRDFFASLFS